MAARWSLPWSSPSRSLCPCQRYTCGHDYEVRTMKDARGYMFGVLILVLALPVVSCSGAKVKEDAMAAPATPTAQTTQGAAVATPSGQSAPATPPGQTTPTAPKATTTATAPPITSVPPRIPHPLDGRDNCLMCHRTGVGKAPAVRASHAGRTNDQCRTCHQPG